MSGISFGQECLVKGICVDSSKARVSGVTVRSPQSPGQFEITNSIGEFTFKIPCDDTVVLYLQFIEQNITKRITIRPKKGREEVNLGTVELGFCFSRNRWCYG